MRRIREPGHQPDEIHGNGNQDVLELRLGEASVARLSQAEDARPLRQSALDASSEAVARLEVRRLLPLTGRQ
jgi:hypothetical protein